MLSNCSLWHKLQHSHGDIQFLSTSSVSFNPGQTQQAHQQECQHSKARDMTMDRCDTTTEKKSSNSLSFYKFQET